jgi:transcriptional regulator with XRE-family HTH domain
MALPESQALLHCSNKVALYNIEMTLGKRIKAARERLQPKPTQADVAKFFSVTDKAVSSWERDETVPELDKIAKLAKRLQVPCLWLLEGGGPPPEPDSLEVEIEHLAPQERAVVAATVSALRKTRGKVA